MNRLVFCYVQWYIEVVVTCILVVLYVGIMLFLGIHEEWLERGNPHFWLGWGLAAAGVLSALALMVLL